MTTLKTQRHLPLFIISFFLIASTSFAADKTASTEKSSSLGMQNRPIEVELDAYAEASKSQVPPKLLEAGRLGTDELKKTGIVEKALKVGQKMPSFILPDASGRPVSSDSLLAKGSLVLVFYRGAWCPFCNIYLRGMQRYLPEIQAAGGTLVAISGEPADRSADVMTTDSLTFPVLSDTGLISTRKFGLVYELPKVINDAVIEIGFDMAKYYNAPKAELPISATYVVGKDGVVRYTYLEVDYKKRAEPSDVIAALKKLKM